MKIRSAFLTEMSGKLGGAVGSTSRGGVQYLRKLVIPSNPRTLLQTAIRSAVSSAASAWRNLLSETNQELWWDLATGSQTGQSLFAKINQPRIYAVNSARLRDENGDIAAGGIDPVILQTPPASLTTQFTPPVIVIDDSANTLALTTFNAGDSVYDDRAVDAPALVYVYATHQQTTSRLSRQHPYQLIGAIKVGSTVDVAIMAVTIDLAAMGFTTGVGEVMYVKMVGQNALGGISTPIENRVVITA